MTEGEGAATTERFAALNGENGWVPRNNGAGKRPWFCMRDLASPTPSGMSVKYHYDKAGYLIRYTLAGAIKKCEELNAQEEANL